MLFARKAFNIVRGFYFSYKKENEDLKNTRLKICSSCLSLDYDVEFFCGNCKCGLDQKSRVPDEECPLKKW